MQNFEYFAEFIPKKHVRYLKRYVHLMPSQAASFDSSRLTIAFFAISGLDVLNALDVFNEEERQDIIEWIYRLQVVPDIYGSEDSWERCGFLGSSTILFPEGSKFTRKYECGHLAMTYTALSTLCIIEDDLSRVNRAAVIKGVKALQQKDGSFCAILGGSENDMRFVYCAACVCYILQDWSGMDMDLVMQYILQSLTYEGGIAQGPGLEAHGGTTYCAVAALSLMGKLEECLSSEQLERLKYWCLLRQTSGFQGRPNKPADTCYSFWVGATLKLLGVYEMIDYKQNRDFIMSTEDSITGGFSKWADTNPDTLHTYFGICGLSLMGEKGLRPIHPGLNFSQRAAEHLHTLHKKWNNE